MNPHLSKDEGTVRLKTFFYCDACQWIKILKKVFSRKSICSKMKNCRNNFDISQICLLFCFIFCQNCSLQKEKKILYILSLITFIGSALSILIISLIRRNAVRKTVSGFRGHPDLKHLEPVSYGADSVSHFFCC